MNISCITYNLFVSINSHNNTISIIRIIVTLLFLKYCTV